MQLGFQSFSEYKFLIVANLLVVVFLFLIQQNIALFIGLAAIIILFILFKNDFLLLFIIVTFFTLTSTISPNLRLVVQVTNFIFLSILFLRKYGLDIKNYPKVPDLILYFISALLIVMLVSSIHSDYTLVGLTQFIRTMIFMIITYFLYSLIEDNRQVKIILSALLLCALVFFIFLIYRLIEVQFNFIELYIRIFEDKKFEYLNKNYLGVFFSVVIILIISLSYTQLYKQSRKLFYSILPLLFMSLIITNSRASLFCLLISVSFLFFLFNRKVFYTTIVILTLFVILLLLSPFSEVILQYLRIENLGTGREFLINASLEVIKQNFVLGAGPGGTKFELYKNIPYMLHTPEEWMILKNYIAGDIGQSHNFYIFYFADLGIFGFILSLSFVVIFFKLCHRVIKKYKNLDENIYYLSIGITCIGIFLFVRGLFEPQNLLTYGGISADLLFWLLISIICFYLKSNPEVKLETNRD